MNQRILALSVFLAGLGAAAPASAQFNPRITIFGASSFVRGERSFAIAGQNFQTQFVDGGKFRVRGSLDLTSRWTLEGDYSFGRNNLRVNESGTTTSLRDFGAKLNQVHFNLVHFWTSSKRRVRPYLGTGIGLTRYTPTDAAKSLAGVRFLAAAAAIGPSNQFSFPVAGGLEARFTRWLGMRVDLTDHIMPIPRFSLAEISSGGAFFPVNGVAHNVQAEIGLVFFLKPKR